MARYSRAREKLADAEYRLAVSEGDVRERLRRAYLPLRSLRPEELPLPLRRELREILEEMTRLGPARAPDGVVYLTAIEHTMSRIRNHTARKMAERIYRLHARLSRNVQT